MDPPPAKKIRPYVTKYEREKQLEQQQIQAEPNNTSNQTQNNKFKIKELFLTDETVLDYEDRKGDSVLPRKPWKKLEASKSPVWCLQWCTKYSHLVASTCGNSIKLHDVMKHKDITQVYSIDESSVTRFCDWSRTSSHLVTCNFDGNVNVYDFLSEGKLLNTIKLDCHPTTVKWWKDDDNLVLVGGDNAFLASYDIRTGEKAVTYKVRCGKVLSFDFFPQGGSFVSSTDEVSRQSAENNLIVWDLKTGAKLSSQMFHERYTCPCVKLHQSGSNILAQTTGNYIARFSTQKPFKLNKFVRFQNHMVNEYPVSFDVSSDGKYVYSGSSNGALVCYKHNNGNYLRTIALSRNSEEVSAIDVKCHPVLPSMVAVSDWAGNLFVLK